MEEDENHPEKESKVTDAVHDKGLLGSIIVCIVFVPEADQEIRAQPYAFPADKNHEVIATHDQEQHDEDKQVEVGKEPRESRIIMHIADRVEVDQETNACHHHQHDHGEGVNPESKGDVDVAE